MTPSCITKRLSLSLRGERQWRRAVDRRLQPFGLTEATWLPLIHLARAPAPVRQKDLAASLLLDGSSVVRLIDTLQESGFVERSEGEDRARDAMSKHDRNERCASNAHRRQCNRELERLCKVKGAAYPAHRQIDCNAASKGSRCPVLQEASR